MQPVEKIGSPSAIAVNRNNKQLDDTLEEEHGLGIEDFFAILRRRKVALVIPAIFLFAVTVAVAWTLPKMYRSEAKILVEQQEIPTSFVSSTVSTGTNQRIQIITQRVLTTDNLQKISEKLKLYPDLRSRGQKNAVASAMRNSISVNRIRARGGTIAFSVSYESRSPESAQAVATELASLFLEENLRIRTQSAVDTTGFLQSEAERLRSEITELEEKIVTFKNTHSGRLPQQLSTNLQLLGQSEQRIAQIEQQIRTLEDRKISLEVAMAELRTNPQIGSNQTSAQVQALRVKLAGMLAQFTPDHPDVKRLETEIEALESRMKAQDELMTLQSELSVRRAELAQALERYSPEHRNVKIIQQQVNDLEKRLVTRRSEDVTVTSDGPANFSYINRQIQHRAVDKTIASLRAERSALQAKQVEYEKRIEQIPFIETQYNALIRERDSVVAKYQEIRAKISSARVSENLEKANKGERFSLLEPAYRPIKPFKPNRKKILTLGLIGSVGAGIGTAFIREVLHKSVYGARGLMMLLGVPPLAVIPYIRSPADRRRRFRKWLLVIFCGLVLLVAGAAFVHLLIEPLDVLWTKILSNIDSIWITLVTRIEAMFESIST